MAIDKNRWMDYVGLEWFWDRIKKRYDKKLDKVVSKDDSIKVTGTNMLEVQISEQDDNILQVKTEHGNKGLYVPKTKALHKLTFGAGEEYVYDGSEDVNVPVYTGDYE